MAIVYAIRNGNWGDGTTWSSGSVPTAADDVYTNGYIVALNIDVEASIITNATCPITNLSGGYCTNTGTLVISANVKAVTMTLIVGSGVTTTIINGNIEGQNGAYGISATNTSAITVNGNVYPFSFHRTSNYLYIYVNGNVFSIDNPITHCSNGFTETYEINGAIHLGCKLNDLALSPFLLHINGVLKMYNDYTINEATSIQHTIAGVIDISNSVSGKFYSGSFNIGNDTTIITRETTPIPQSVVLKGYEYGDKIGTLEVVNIPDTTLDRLANCATMDEVAELSITIANKDNEE